MAQQGETVFSLVWNEESRLSTQYSREWGKAQWPSREGRYQDDTVQETVPRPPPPSPLLLVPLWGG